MRINLISNPRNVSTALMYSFAQRADMSVIDEPFYGYYLSNHEVSHPGQEEILTTMPTSLEGVFNSLDNAHRKEHLFIKGMAHHLDMVATDHLRGMTHIIFIREPKQMIASFAKVMPDPTMKDIGLADQLRLLKSLEEFGEPTVVLDSGQLLADPAQMLSRLCERIGLRMDAAMLRWKSGGIAEDGVWAPHWYGNVHQTTGFAVQSTSSRPFPEHCRDLLDQAMPIYRQLMMKAL